ncbi:MAG TPA: sulfotransferase, partial [Steroidobacteraceae bacterium]|nr:sulfotransferase [Steroidobacteraceae bacterium]
MPAQPTHPDEHAALAAGLLEQGDARQAEVQCRAALALDPDHAGALGMLGLILHGQGRFDEAEAVYLRLAAVEPLEGLHWMNVGTARRCAGRLDDALSAFARAAALGASSADFLYNVALAHIERTDLESAHALLAKALALAPEDTEIRFRYAQCCHDSLRLDEALAALAGWEQYGAPTQALAAEIGHLLLKLGAAEQAETAVRQATAGADPDPQARLVLVQVLERSNRVEEARAVLERLAADPQAAVLGGELQLAQARLAQRSGQHDVAIRLYREAVDACQDFARRHFSLFPLAKALDAAGRYEEAHAALLEAHASQVEYLRRAAPVTALRSAPLMGITEYGCDPADVALWQDAQAPGQAASPVFIVAFPRSGTTLLELALDAHPQLQSMDEQPFVQNALDELVSAGARYPRHMSPLGAAELARVRAGYWERVGRKLTLRPGQRLVDKNPLNLLRLPAIRRVFPKAQILLAIRHPCDVLLSCYMQHFRAPDFALMCRDLPTLATGFRRAFDFWYQQQAMLAAC